MSAAAETRIPETACATPSPEEADLANQPADVAFVIRRLLELSGNRGSRLTGRIDPTEIAVSGHSDGGDTVAAARTLARQARASDAFRQGTADTWNLTAASQQLYPADTAGMGYYLNLPGADHFAPYHGDGAPEPIVARVTIDFLDYYLLGERDCLDAIRRASKVPSVAEMVGAGQPPP